MPGQPPRIVALSALALALLAPGRARAEVGVAFVHGIGDYTDPAIEYWSPEFIDSVRRGLPDPTNYIVVDCDFTRFMWEPGAAGCVADQLTTFIATREITSLVVIAHSNGNNVIRWILSNPTYDSRYPPLIAAIDRVVGLAPASLGTPLADAVVVGNVFERSLGWLLGVNYDAVVMLQPGHMAYYNDHWLLGTRGRPALPRPLWTIVGTDVEASPLDRDSYCGGYARNLGLKTTQIWLGDCSDGFLTCDSQSAAGEVWHYDVEFTRGAEPLSHTQSRHACFGLDRLLRDDLASPSQPPLPPAHAP